MNQWSQWSVVAGWMLFGLTALFCLPAMWEVPRRSFRRLIRNLPDLNDWPKLSVVVAAKDEEAAVSAMLTALLSSNYPNLEIVFVNDRSSDRTGDIADEFAQKDSRLVVVHVKTLPDGWLGKCHGLHCASERATGDYLLFTDGDVLFEPDALRLAIRYATQWKLDHLCLLPNVITSSYLERVIVAQFGLLFLWGTMPWLQRFQLPRTYFGVGAFNLVSRSAYHAVGGHVPIRMDVVDDVKLGKLLYKGGFRADFAVADSFVKVRWQDSAWGVIRGLEKNAFAGVNYSVCELLLLTLVNIAVFLLPWLGWALIPQNICWPLLATWLLTHLTYGRLGLAFGAGLSITPALLVGAVAVLFAFWRSAYITLRQNGVSWRDTHYSLQELRRNIYR